MRREVDPDVYCPQAALVDEETAAAAERRLARFRAKHEAEKKQEQERLAEMQQLQRQRGIILAGGALAALALGFVWYRRQKKNSRKAAGRRRRKRQESGLPKDLLLDEDDDGFNGTEEELRRVFDEAAKVARAFPNGLLPQRDQLMLYGLYKQAREGDRNDDDAPSKVNVVAYAKHDAWGKFKGLPQRFAMIKYCEVVHHFSSGGASAYSNGGGGRGVADDADVVYEDDKGEVDEDGCPIEEDSANNGPEGGIMTTMGLKPSTLSGNHSNMMHASSNHASPEMRLRTAAIANDVHLLQEVIDGQCDIDDADDLGLGALHLAADRNSVDCLRILVETGANVNAVDADGIGVLQTALVAGLDVEALRMLLEAGADPDNRDDDGDSARTWVEEEGENDVVELFKLFPPRR